MRDVSKRLFESGLESIKDIQDVYGRARKDLLSTLRKLRQ